jgi:transcriptional regulator
LYIPEYHRIDDTALSVSFMQANPFAILVSNTENGLFATHLPVLVKDLSGDINISGHVARANDHWKFLEQGGEVLITFHGPHAYISPTLYESRESVPTWNYAAVHAYGRATTLHKEGELAPLLEQIITQFDMPYLSQWRSLSEEYRARMMRHIVGFEIQATRVETKFKLSQNRSRKDQESVIQMLAQSEDSAVTKVARLMWAQSLGMK